MTISSGSCLCGKVTYEISSAPLNVIHCHCRMCQKQGGGAFLTYAAYPSASLRFTGALPVAYRSSPAAQRFHCGTCGSPVSFTYDGEPGVTYIAVGTLDEPGAVTPREHWFVRSKVSWLKLDDGLVQKNEM